MVFLCLFSLVVLGASLANGVNNVSCPGMVLRRIGCFNSKTPSKNLPKLIHKEQINYKEWDKFLPKFICDCVAKAGKKKSVIAFRSNECRTGSLYAKEGSAPIQSCSTWGPKQCKKGVDCLGSTTTAFVYAIEPKPTPKPTTKKTTKKPTTKKTTKPTTPNKNAPENLQCYTYAIKMKLVKPPPGKQGSPAYSKMQCHICKTIRTIYRCYPCYQSVHFINVTTTGKDTHAHLVLKFSCKAAHLKSLVDKLQKGAIVSATCHDGKCPQTPLLAQTVPGCTMVTACPVIPACSVSACGAAMAPPPPPPPPAPIYAACPVSCPATCAPACSVACCKSGVEKKKKAKPALANLVYQDGQPLYDYSLDE